MSAKSILLTQRHTLHLFLTHPSTRTPIIVLYVASFGGALHAAVTTYYYLSIGATTIDIGQLGFIMSVGALIGSPMSGYALDKYGPWRPISVCAVGCAVGCFWRGVASSVTSLRVGAILLGAGVNLWSVVLAHLIKSFPRRMRSEVLSGFSVQLTILQLCGKGMFPIMEYILHATLRIQDELTRYRIHMGLCTFFCFYGVVALFMDKKNVSSGGELSCSQSSQSQQQLQRQVDYRQMKHLDSNNGDEWEDDDLVPSFDGNATAKSEIELADVTTRAASSNKVEGDSSTNSSLSSFVREPEDVSMMRLSTPSFTKIEQGSTTESQNNLLTNITLTIALLIQSISTTFLAVLWPLLSKDLFSLSAHKFGIITFISSIVSTGAVASFPIVERMDRVGGRVNCAALGFGVGAVLCFLFCYCSFGGGRIVYGGLEVMDLAVGSIDGGLVKEVSGGNSRFLEDGDEVLINGVNNVQQQFLLSTNQWVWHAISAILFQSAICFIEPSLKSILSLSMSSSSTRSKGSSLGFTMGYLTMLGSAGGMIGNLSGTWMYKISKEAEEGSRYGQGALPFLVTGILLTLSSVMIKRLDEPINIAADDNSNETNITTTDRIATLNKKEAGIDLEVGSSNDVTITLGSREVPEAETSDGCCLTLRETTYDLKLD